MVKVLVIEDEHSIQKVIRTNLSASGYTVATAYSGEEGLELLRAEKPDLVLLDLLMPGISGWDVLEKMKESGDIDIIPVIVITASGWGNSEKKLRNMGASDYLVKPFELEELMQKVKGALKER